MGRRGPAAKPTVLKEREGTVRPSRAPQHEPQPSRGVPACPKGVAGDADAKHCWNVLAPHLANLRLITQVDGLDFEGLCRAYSVAVKADRIISSKGKKGGVLVKAQYGDGWQANPAISISRLAWAEVRKFAAEFGLSPAARTRVNAPPADPVKDEAEDFLFGGAVVGRIA
jgi:P27 family predicted phage terminase small subunit